MTQRNKVLKASFIEFLASLILFIIDYVLFHFVGESGFTSWQPEPGKPFITLLVGLLATLFLFASAMSVIFALIFTDKDNKNN